MPNGSPLANLAKSNSLALHAEVQRLPQRYYMPVQVLSPQLVTSWLFYQSYLSAQGPCVMPTKVDF